MNGKRVVFRRIYFASSTIRRLRGAFLFGVIKQGIIHLFASVNACVETVAVEREGSQHDHPKVDVIFCRHNVTGSDRILKPDKQVRCRQAFRRFCGAELVQSVTGL